MPAREPSFNIDAARTFVQNRRVLPARLTCHFVTSMSSAVDSDLAEYCRQTAEAAKAASYELAKLATSAKNDWLNRSAKALVDGTEEILSANQKDLQAASENDLSEALTDRLTLNGSRIEGIATALREIAMQRDPVGEIIDGQTLASGLQLTKKRVPLGVVFFIYESRPNVTADAAAICVKSGNAVILRGGKEARHSSRAIVDILSAQASAAGLPDHAVQLVSKVDREAVGEFLKLDELIDVTIPRGGEQLIRRVAAEARMPVIKHYDGNCHVYVDEHADLEMAATIVENAKCQRMGVCNACESLLVHQAIAESALPLIAQKLHARGVEIRADQRAADMIPDALPATEEDWRTEYLGPIISVAVVNSLKDAVTHINRYGSHHTDAIVTSNLKAADEFTQGVDSSAVMVNASTRFNDGGEFGLGAEIGISTDKFHARGPCGARELTTYKYIVVGNGQTK